VGSLPKARRRRRINERIEIVGKEKKERGLPTVGEDTEAIRGRAGKEYSTNRERKDCLGAILRKKGSKGKEKEDTRRTFL